MPSGKTPGSKQFGKFRTEKTLDLFIPIIYKCYDCNIIDYDRLGICPNCGKEMKKEKIEQLKEYEKNKT